MARNTSRKKKRSTPPANVYREEQDESIIIPLLASRSMHIPGNTWYQDWIHYFKNNHILFGICLHHPLHPIQWWKRILAMLGSVSFGIVTTTTMYLWDIYDPERMRDTLFYIDFMDDQFVFTKGMVLLWTIGGSCHAIFDILVWYIMACSCFHPGGCCYRDRSIALNENENENEGEGSLESSRLARQDYLKNCGTYLLIPVIGVLLVLMTLGLLVRASFESNDDDMKQMNANYDDNIQYQSESVSWMSPWRNIQMDQLEVESFSFLAEYFILVSLTWFVYFPIAATILISGILGCNGRIPVLGGRPRDKKRIEKLLLRNDDAYIEMS